MKPNYIPFQIGMHYENWEFCVDILPDRINGFDSYMNNDDSLNMFLNFHSDKTELIFSLETLVGVILTFNNKSLKFFKGLKESTIKTSSTTSKNEHRLNFDSDDIIKWQVSKSLIIKNETVYFVYCNDTMLLPILTSLL